MAQRDYSANQQRIINRYYDNRDSVSTQKLAELVSDLALAESEKKRASLWKRVEKALENLDASAAMQEQIARILEEQDTGELARLLTKLQ